MVGVFELLGFVSMQLESPLGGLNNRNNADIPNLHVNEIMLSPKEVKHVDSTKKFAKLVHG